MKLSLSVFITSYGEQATTSFWDVRFRECAQARVSQGSGPSLGVRKGSVSGGRTGTALTLPSTDRFSASSQGWEASAVVFSAQIKAQILQLSDSEELDVVSANARDTEDSPPQFRAYEELVEVVTRAVEKLTIDWPAEREDVRSKGKLDKCFLPSRAQPQRWGLPFFFLTSTPRCRDHGRKRFPIESIGHYLTIPLY